MKRIPLLSWLIENARWAWCEWRYQRHLRRFD